MRGVCSECLTEEVLNYLSTVVAPVTARGPGLCHIHSCISRCSDKAFARARLCLMNERMARPLPSEGDLRRKQKPQAACPRRSQQRVKSRPASPQAPGAHSPFDPSVSSIQDAFKRGKQEVSLIAQLALLFFLFLMMGGGKENGPWGHILPGNQPPSCQMPGLPKGQINSFLLKAGEGCGPEMARLTGWGP